MIVIKKIKITLHLYCNFSISGQKHDFLRIGRILSRQNRIQIDQLHLEARANVASVVLPVVESGRRGQSGGEDEEEEDHSDVGLRRQQGQSGAAHSGRVIS